MSKAELFHAEDEDEEKRLEALYCPSWWHDQTFKRHILTKKTTKNKRHLRGTEGVHETNLKSVRAMMPYA
jgi:large subunit ribosomal protein L35